MQKNKNQNKFMILLIAFTLLLLAIVSSIGAVSADTYVDTSLRAVDVSSVPTETSPGVWQYYVTWSSVYTPTGSGTVNSPYSSLNYAYNNGDNDVRIATGYTASNTLNINNNARNNVVFSQWNGAGSSLTMSASAAGAPAPGYYNTNPGSGTFYYHDINFGTNTDLDSVSISVPTTNSFTPGSGRTFGIGSVTASTGTLNFNSGTTVRNSLTGTGGTQNFNSGSTFASGTISNGGYQNFAPGSNLDGPVTISAGTQYIQGTVSGAITVQGTANTTFDNPVIFNNPSSITQTAGTVTIMNTVLNGNPTITHSGGLIRLWDTIVQGYTNGFMTFNAGGNGEFVNTTFRNNNRASGNGAVFLQTGGDLKFTNCNFTNNNAAGDGGAIHQTGGTINLQANLVYNGTAWTSQFWNGTNWNTAYTQFTGNNATNGGAIYTTVNTITGYGRFNSNRATTSGGAVFASSDNFIISSFFNNNGALEGGGLYHSGTGTLTLSGSTFENNYANTNGGGVYSRARTIYALTFTGNHADAGSGGAIYATSTDVTIVGGTFTSNHARDNGGAIRHTGAGSLNVTNGVYTSNYLDSATGLGGAIHSDALNAYITGGTYTSNNASNGGAVYLTNTAGTLDVSANFDNNRATAGSGGAIYQAATGGYLNVSAGRFTGNTATVNGGAIFSGTGVAIIRNVDRFYNNTATNGGAVYLTNTAGTLDVINSYFDNNRATAGSGGAINQASTSGYLNVSGGRFNGNTATVNGGAIFTEAFEAIIRNVNSFNGNQANDGGAIYSSNANGNLTVSDSRFTNNRATRWGGAVFSNSLQDIYNNDIIEDGSAQNGGGIYYNGVGTLNITNNTRIRNNNATQNGGGVYSDTADEVIITDSTISGNTAGNDGGGLWTTAPEVTVDNSFFNSNTAGVNGGGIFYTEVNGYLNITDTEFNYNEAGNYGGGIHTNTLDFTVTNSRFNYNRAGINGGGIHYFNPDGDLNITGLEFIGNHANNDGGGIWTNASNVFVDTSLFDGNTAGRDGGGIHYTEDGIFNVTDSFFNNNSAGRDGGGIFTNTTYFYVTDTEFNYNHADRDGGGIHYVNPDGEFYIDDLTFRGNTAGNRGGGVYSNVDEFDVSNSRFFANGAAYGGGMYFFGIALNITNTSFRTNYATVDGGALWTSSGEVSISDFSEFISNRAGNDGGAIYQVSSNGYLNIDETTFTSNYARRDGGAICTNGADVNITGSNLISNTAGRFGGGYYNVNGNSNLLISRSTLNYNYANQGGAVYTKSNSTLITYSTLNGNYAYNTGGAVYQTGYGYLTINRSNLTGNAAYYSGGAVYTTVGTTVEYSTFTDSVAENYVGGAICNEGPELRVFHSNFIGNTAMVYGAAIYNYEHGRLVVASSSFINNTGVRTSNKANYALVNIEDQVGAIANFGRAEITGAYFTGNALCILDNGNMFVTASNFTANRWAFLLNGTGSYVFGNTIVDNNLAFNVTGKDTVIEYNRIVVPFGGKALFNFGVNTDADYNWWGQNDFRNLIYGINLRNWFVMYLQTDIQPHNFANPGTVLSYTYHFELNTKDPWFYKYLPEFYVDLDINGNKYSWLATGVAGTGIYHWDIYFTNTNYYYASAQLDHEISGFNVNNYSTIIKAHSYNARIGETVNLTATLTDAYGTPMINRKVTFYINGTIVGSAYTDLDGVARLPYKATRIGNFSVNAYFAGDKYSAAYYITDPPITGVDWYKAIASYSGFLKVNNDSFRIVGKFDTGKVNGSNVNVSSRVGSSFNFLYTVTNKNPGTVELVIKMVIPAGLKYVKSVVYDQKGNVITNASISKVVFNKKTNTLTWYLAATGSASINITFKSLKVGKYTIKPVITSKDANLNVSAGRLNIDVKAPDLIISKVKKVNGVYQITVKNIGSATAGKSVLRFVCGCKEYSVLVDVKSLAPGKSTTVTSKFPTGGRDHVKFVIANYNKKIVESNYKNNKYRLGRV